MKKYKLLLFDADGTLFDYDKGEAKAFLTTMDQFGVSGDPESLLKAYREINLKIWGEFEEKKISADELKIVRFDRLFERLGEKGIDSGAVSKRYLSNLAECPYLLPGAKEVIEACAGKYKMGIITNGLTAVQKRRFALSEISGYMDAVIISEELGIPKPESGIFEHAMGQFPDIKKEETLMIGDNLKADIGGAESFGIDTCWIENGSTVNTTIIPTYRIKKISELLELLL